MPQNFFDFGMASLPGGGASSSEPSSASCRQNLTQDRGEEQDIRSRAEGSPRFWTKTAPAALCVLVDYFGLVTIAPLLPYLLAEVDHVEDPDAWLGPIMSVQFGAGIAGHLCWGALSDRFGAQRILIIAMLGDAACFGATAFCAEPQSLLLVRGFAGFFTPLVPATAFVLERCRGPELVDAFGKQAAAALSGSVLADGVVAFLYPVLGWAGVNAMSAVAALIAVVSMKWVVPALPRTSVVEDSTAGPQGAARALCTGEVVTSMLTAMSMGWLLDVLVVIRPEVLREQFGFAVRQ